MHIYLLPLLIALAAAVAVDAHIWRELRKCRSRTLRVAGGLAHVLTAPAALAVAVAVMLWPTPPPGDVATVRALMMALWGWVMLYASKGVWAAIYALRHQVRHRAVALRAIAGTALAGAAATLAVMLHGTLVTPNEIQVLEATVASERLPQAFDGYRIAHISDLHLGTRGTDTMFTARCVAAVNALHPDLIVFTGDLVNTTAAEAVPHAAVLHRLSAPGGVLAVLGNHDYDDYVDCTREQWVDELRRLCDAELGMGWTVLRNTHTTLHRGGDSIVVAATENYSRSRLPDYSRLDSVLAGCPAGYTLLLQHNPELWREQVLGRTAVDLTLSGHTHAMQAMLTVGGRRLSPARLRYREWGGLYSEGGQHLYVNTGLGMVGVPMRLGAKPEVTLITLIRH